MIKKTITIILILFIAVFSEPVLAGTTKYIKNRETETQIFDNYNRQELSYAILKTLQNSDFIIEDYNSDYGYIKAKKVFKKKYVNKRRLATQSFLLALTGAYTAFSWGTGVGTMVTPTMHVKNELRDKTVLIRTSIILSDFGQNKTKVRANFQGEFLQNADGYSYYKAFPLKVVNLHDEEIYREFFNQIKDFLNNEK